MMNPVVPAVKEILRAAIFHTPGDPFAGTGALRAFGDGALAIAEGRVLACGDYREVAVAHPDASVRDLRGGYIIPGLIDTHVHFPQVRLPGAIGYSLQDWLDQRALPEEARLADAVYAGAIAHEFIDALVSHGTTAAMVFGSHFASAMEILFQAADQSGLRICSGLVLSDRALLPELRQSPDAAYRESRLLIDRFHGKRRLRYAATPRFAVSASEATLEICGALLREDASLRFTTHINENEREIEEAARLFPNARDYLEVYERFGLVGRRSVLAHNVHAMDAEIQRVAARGAAIASCPHSNAALGSGIFPLRRHLDAGARCALGTDVGAGTGFGMLQEGLQMYLMQRVAPQPVILTAAQLLYLATRAGAEALGLEDETGDFEKGRAADLVYLKPPRGSVLAGVLKRTESAEQILGALFALAGAESVREVQVAGEIRFRRNIDETQ
jgi:guanine deaminase